MEIIPPRVHTDMILRLLLLVGIAVQVIAQECSQGWLKYQSTCFLLESKPRTFQLARDYCQSQQADLAVITSTDMNAWMAQQTSQYSNVFWIGLHDIQSDGSFTWIDGTALTDSIKNWAPNEPNNSDGIGEDCVEMYPGGTWNDEQCLAPQWFICSRSLSVVPTCDTAAGWEHYNRKCYLWITDSKDFNDATTYCTLMDGYIISINDAGEQSFANSMQLSNNNFRYWTSLSAKAQAPDQYVWQDGTDASLYSNWGPGEPINEPGGDSCVMIKSYKSGNWSVDACTEDKRFICERPEGTCATGWVLYGGQCYQFNSLLRTWFDAKYYCESQGGFLASILNDAENGFITSNLKTIGDDNVDMMWIGYSDSLHDGTFAWSHETNSDYTNWASGLPSSTYGQPDCAYMATSDTSGIWYQRLCELLSGFVCKIKVGSVVTPVQPVDQIGSCIRGWDLYGDYCYYMTTLMKTYDDAQTECTNINSAANLVSIESAGEQSFLTERLYYVDESMWIGLHDLGTEDSWMWEDGTAYNFTNWAPGEPNNAGNEDCVHLEAYFYKIGTWNDIDCSRVYRFICKMPKSPQPAYTTPVPTTFPPSDRCGSGWIYDMVSGNCYKYDINPKYWADADDQCHYEGGYLTSVGGLDETNFLQQFATYYLNNNGINSFWIGLHDANMEYGFQWTDYSPLAYLNWNSGEPNDYGGEDCVEMFSSSGKWNDLSCTGQRPYICKKNVYTNRFFSTYTNSRLDTASDAPISNLWPEECAFLCVNSPTCRSFNYYRSGRQCSLLPTDKDSSGVGGLTPEFEDPWDYYHRDFSAPTYAPLTTLNPVYGCGQNEVGYRGFCYSLLTDMSTFSNMQDVCGLRSATPVSIADVSENNFVLSLMQTGNQPGKTISGVWLGLTDADREGTYAWTDGSPVTFTLWAIGEPNNNANEDDCVMFSADVKGWMDMPCTTSTYGVCKKPKSTSNVVDPSNDGCPTGWLKYMSSCYLPVTENKLSWADARDDCVDRGVRLTTFTSNYEQAYVASQLGAIFSYDGDFWIGLSDTGIPGTYVWVDGTYPTLAFWGPGQPDDTNGKCVAMIGNSATFGGMWVDEPCTKLNNYICEQPVDGATDTPYTQRPVTNPSNDGCAVGDIGYGSNCFRVFEKNSSYQLRYSDARAQCLNIGGDLASFHAAAEEQYIVTQYTPEDPDNFYGFWMGLNDMSLEGAWQWSDGSAVIYVNWGDGEPNDHSSSEECVEMFLNEGRGWNDITCMGYRSWICKIRKQFAPTTPLPTVGVCPSDSTWKYVAPYCYYISDLVGEGDRRSWWEAEDWCNEQTGHLVSITSSIENSLIVQMTPLIATQYWIGLRQETIDGPFSWCDGSVYDYVNWARNEPNNHNGEESCAEIQKYNGIARSGLWNDQNCGVPTPFICKKRYGAVNPITKAPTEPPTGGCNNGYFKYFNRCYRMGGKESTDRFNWQDARDVCIGEGGNLVGIHSKEVQALFTSMLIDLPTDTWIGFSDLGSTGQYHWTDGKTTVYTNWLPGQPNGIIPLPGAPARDCVELVTEEDSAGMWNDEDCSVTIAYICEKDLEQGQNENPPSNSFCDDNSYYKYGDSCFKLDTTPRAYQSAQDFCEAEGGNLASIADAYYESFVEYMLFSSGVQDAWIGMTSNTDGQYTWIDGWPVYFSQWGENEPSQKEGEGCVLLNDVPSWDDTSCGETHPVICRTTSAKAPTPVPLAPGWCTDEQTEFGGHCYFVSLGITFKEWYSARADCQTNHGGELASIHTKEENEFIKTLVGNTFGVTTVWIGLTRSETGGFRWTDDTPVDYAHWANGEPTEVWRGTYEDCVEMYTNEYGNWNDADCYTGASYVCKIEKYWNGTDPMPINNKLSGGAIAGIVIACIVVITAGLLVVAWFMGARNAPKSPTTDPFPTPTPPAGFDNALYTANANETKIQVDEKQKEASVAEA